jgi:hypothetical protein
MATGRLGTANITTTAATTVYTVPASTFSVVSVNIVNRSSSAAALIRLAVSATSTPGADEWIEFDSSLVANGVLERTGIVVDAGKLIVAQPPNEIVLESGQKLGPITIAYETYGELNNNKSNLTNYLWIQVHIIIFVFYNLRNFLMRTTGFSILLFLMIFLFLFFSIFFQILLFIKFWFAV